jgi:hypothetical protein
MNIGTIQNGTNAGWRRVKSEKPRPWRCCETDLKAHWAKCPSCQAPRPS